MRSRKKYKTNNLQINAITASLVVLFVGLFCFTAIEQRIAYYIGDSEAVSSSGRVAGATELSAVVPVTPLNTLSQELNQKEQDLIAKQKELQAKEDFLNSRFLPTPAAIRTLYFLLIGIFILLLMNFYLDSRRFKAIVPKLQKS